MLYDWFQHIEFAWPWMVGLTALPLLLIWWYVYRSDAKQGSFMVSAAQAFRASSWKSRLMHIPFILRILAITALIIALARPRIRNDRELKEGEGIDIVLCMDVSGSMASKDILPSRMEAAKEVAEEFVRSRPVDRIGLVIFSGESFTQCPITNDHSTLLAQIEGLESRRYLTDGTVIGEGLATATDRLSQSKHKSKVIILLTDGKEDPPETRLIDPLTALDIAKAQQVKVYTVGMSAAPPAPAATGNNRNAKSPVGDFLDEQLLQRIASETGGQYFRARDKDGLGAIYKQIDRLEKSKVEIRNFRRYEEKFLPFVLAALAFLFLEVILRFTVFRRFP